MEQRHPNGESLGESLLLSRPLCGAVVSLGSYRHHQSEWTLGTVGNSVSGVMVENWVPATQWDRHQTRPSGIEVLPSGGCLQRKVLRFSSIGVMRYLSIHRGERILPIPSQTSLKWKKREGKQHLLKWFKCASDHATCFIFHLHTALQSRNHCSTKTIRSSKGRPQNDTASILQMQDSNPGPDSS